MTRYIYGGGSFVDNHFYTKQHFWTVPTSRALNQGMRISQ